MTYLFEGEMLHRDSLGTEQLIRPGAVNWMTAGKGIVHSERAPIERRKSETRMHGLQLWVALPKAHEEMEPTFQHHPEASIPAVELPGARLRVIAGTAFGATAPVSVLSELFYVEAQLERGARLDLPDHSLERAAYVVDGAVSCDGKPHRPGSMLVFRDSPPACLTALEPSRVMLLGGAPLDGDRHIWWNFVSSSSDRIVEAQQAWKERRFPVIPGDAEEFILAPPMVGRPR